MPLIVPNKSCPPRAGGAALSLLVLYWPCTPLGFLCIGNCRRKNLNCQRTYERYFNQYADFSFYLSRTDMGDVCFESKLNDDETPVEPDKLNIKDSKKKDVVALLRSVTSEKQQFYKNLLNPNGVLESELQEAESEMDKSNLVV
ncbi:hypothetical protein AVEN_229456-1 [Araneus ventricosus]|uniref:Uncharacterized protein n=1 Tax=Araneus ventricosus TaxID=182803 RepID=A0A4Y2JMS1_ARAVE|nr:hypothetical protein AVEN_229456-1 [Araneus ventricosus]